jgi:hypothetical protein
MPESCCRRSLSPVSRIFTLASYCLGTIPLFLRCVESRRRAHSRCRSALWVVQGWTAQAGRTWEQTRSVCTPEAARRARDGTRGGKDAMPHRKPRLRAHVMCWVWILAVLVSGTGPAAAGLRFTLSDLEKQAAAFLRRLGFALQGEVVCATVAIGTHAHVCQALGSPPSPDPSLQKAQLLAFYCSHEGVCWFAPERVP